MRVARVIDTAGGVYHVINRGNDERPVFLDADDHERFIEILKETGSRMSFRLFHFALIVNHYHLILEAAAHVRLAEIGKRLNQLYALYFKEKYGLNGHLWQGRFKSFLINSDSYLQTCGAYVELNAVRAGLCQHPENFRWSSCSQYIAPKGTVPFDSKRDCPLLRVEASPAFLAMGATREDREKEFGKLLRMWMEYPVTKNRARNFFRRGAASRHPMMQGR